MAIIFDGERGRGEAEYLQWIAKNRNGLVVQSGRKVSPSYLVLHRASCKSITVADRADGLRPFTSGRYVKICATETDDLTRYFRTKRIYNFSKFCSKCRPEKFRWPIFIKSIDKNINQPTDAETFEDGRRRWAEILVRRGAPQFRQALIRAYDGCCAASGCNAVDALEAAHIVPYCQSAINKTSNGLLLRADIHTLFDLGLVSVDADRKWIASSKLKGTIYEKLNGRQLRETIDSRDMADAGSLNWHRRKIYGRMLE